MRTRIIAAISFLVLLTVSIWAQRDTQNARPTATLIFTASDAAAMIAKSPADKNALGQRMLQLGPYSVNMEHRVMGQAAAVHCYKKNQQRRLGVGAGGRFAPNSERRGRDHRDVTAPASVTAAPKQKETRYPSSHAASPDYSCFVAKDLRIRSNDHLPVQLDRATILQNSR